MGRELITGYKTNIWLTDQERSTKAAEDLNDKLDRHLSAMESSSGRVVDAYAERVPSYLPAPQVHIDTDRLADAQYETSDRVFQLVDGQRELIRRAGTSNAALKRMVAEQRTSNGHLESIDATTGHVRTLMADMGLEMGFMNNQQIVTRMAIQQALYRVQSTYLQAHEEQMLAHQRNQGLLEAMMERVGQTDAEREARRLWQQAELKRRRGDFQGALDLLRTASGLDDLNLNVLMTTATVHSVLGNADKASEVFAHAEAVAEAKGSPSHSFVLMNLAGNLSELGRHEHAERVLRRAREADPGNREVRFKHAIAAWRLPGMRVEAIRSLCDLLRANRAYYRAQIVVHPGLHELRDCLKNR